MRAFGTTIEVIEEGMSVLKAGLEEVKEGLKIIDLYDLQLVFENVDDITRDEIMEGIEKIRNGLEIIDGD